MQGARTPYGVIVARLSEKYGVHPNTIKKDIKLSYIARRKALQNDTIAALSMGVESAENEVFRIKEILRRDEEQRTKLEAQGVDPDGDDEEGRSDRARAKLFGLLPNIDKGRFIENLRRWEEHLLKLQGVFPGRSHAISEGGPVVPVCRIPAGPFERLEDGSEGGADFDLPSHVDPNDPRL